MSNLQRAKTGIIRFWLCAVLFAGTGTAPGFEFCAGPASLLALPTGAGFVNDGAKLLTAEQARSLESKLAAFDRETSTQIVIVTIPTLNGRPLEEYSIQLAENWGIGQQGKDNGLLILVPVAERKVRIEVGYGLEGAVPDAYAKRIIDGTITPHFQNGRFYEGLDQSTDQIIGLTRGEYTADDLRQVTSFSADDLLIGRIFVYLFGGMLVLFAFMAGLSSRGRARLPGLGFGIIGVLWALYTEHAYWPNFQNVWFWLRLIIPPLLLFGVFLAYFIRRSTLQMHHARLLKRARNDKTWDKLLRRYDAPAVLKERDALVAQIEASGPGKRTMIHQEATLDKFLASPDDFFTRRNDADLIDIQHEIETARILTSKAYRSESREEYAELLRRERDYFKARKLDQLESADQTRLAESVDRLRTLLADPAGTLGIDSAAVTTATRDFMEGEAGKAEWKKLAEKYAGYSITQTRKTFQARYDAARAITNQPERDLALSVFYRDCIETLRVKPDTFLMKIVVVSSRSTSSSSSSSRSTSSFSSGSSFSSSSSSFGGGSFGGGGASGSW